MREADIDEAVRLRRAISRLARSFAAAATDEGLTSTQASVLHAIAARGPIGVTALLEREHLNPTMLSRVLGRLDAAGLVVRTPHPDDLRAALFDVTDAGMQMQERIKAQRAAIVLGALEALTEEEQVALRCALPALEHLSEAISAPAASAGRRADGPGGAGGDLQR